VEVAVVVVAEAAEAVAGAEVEAAVVAAEAAGSP
jgi:hypothetical protein